MTNNERDKAEARIAELEQQNRAILYDYHNGTPCEQIAWAQEREELKAAQSQAAAMAGLLEESETRIRQLESGYDELRTINNRLLARMERLRERAEKAEAALAAQQK